MNTEYKKRIVEEQIKEKLEYIGGILVEGPKWCGKTMTSSIFSKTIFEFQNPTQLSTIQSYISISNNYILDKEKPILFDEWLEYPPIWDFVRLYIDKNQIIGGFIFTGSTKPLSLLPKHSGAGRIGHILMRPMSLYESGESTGSVSLKSLLNKIPFSPVESNISITDIAYLICRGGWPGAINIKKKENSLKIAYDIYESLINSEINNGSKKRDKDKISKMIKSYARNISTLASYKTMYLDQSNNSNMDDTTFFSYLNILQELFVIENIPAWDRKIKSKVRMRTSEKKQFVDPSLAIAALNYTEEKLLNDFELFGFMFESLCTRDLRVYASSLDGKVYHYHDDSGLEIDNVIEFKDGKYAGIEIKLGSNEIEKSALNLLKFQEKVGEEAEFLMVLTNTKLGYIRTDGIIVLPIGCLKN